MENSILRKLRLSMLAFGIVMGFIFPFYANFFVEWKEGMFVWFFIGCMLAGLTVGLVSFWFVKAILVKKLKLISSLANRIQNRDISDSIHLISKDEIGEIVDGLNASVHNIRDLFEEIIKVFSVSESVLSNIDGNNSAIDRINACINDVVENTKIMADQSHAIEKAVIKGAGISECTENQQLSTIKQVQSFSVIIDSLVERSKEISNILGIIEGIAAETNILALNASVEAARAGEFGKGFAVVASEIRKLATNTSESSQTISRNINLIQTDVSKAYKAVEVITDEVKRNSADINSISSQFKNINETVEEKLEKNKQLNRSVTTLTSSFSEVQYIFNQLKQKLEILNTKVGEYKV